MAYPQDALAPHEELILNLHPHWWYIAKAGIVLALTTVFGLFVVIKLPADNALATPINVILGVAILVEVLWFAKRFLVWICTYFVLTSDRVMSRSGVLSKTGIEIPLERINTVFFHQSILERMLGLGDLEIESASKDGAQVFEDVRKPNQIQKEIYIQMEHNENRKMDRMGAVMTGAQQQQAAAPSIADQINQLASLRDQGHLTEAEFQAKKAELLGRM
jgi:uncharacterized membrane protein YdbT with pleckstrin-like domain